MYIVCKTEAVSAEKLIKTWAELWQIAGKTYKGFAEDEVKVKVKGAFGQLVISVSIACRPHVT